MAHKIGGTQPPKRQSWKLGKVFVVVALLFLILPVGYFFCVVVLSDALSDFQLRQAIKTYPNATYLFDDFDTVRTDTSLTSVFYWTTDSLVDVESYLVSSYGLKFHGAYGYGDSLIAAYQLNGVSPIASTYHRYHGDVCSSSVPHDSEEFKCISISLVSGTERDLCLLPAVTVLDTYRLLQEPYVHCDKLPKTGTLIVYKFYKDAW